jgi:hypothetical protein
MLSERTDVRAPGIESEAAICKDDGPHQRPREPLIKCPIHLHLQHILNNLAQTGSLLTFGAMGHFAICFQKPLSDSIQKKKTEPGRIPSPPCLAGTSPYPIASRYLQLSSHV